MVVRASPVSWRADHEMTNVIQSQLLKVFRVARVSELSIPQNLRSHEELVGHLVEPKALCHHGQASI